VLIGLSIPGEPYALKRARHTRTGITYDPKENVSWKLMAAGIMQEARGDRPILAGPVKLTVSALFALPRSRWLKRTPRPGGWHIKRPDLDNVVKAVKDAAKGVLWLDDSQVCVLEATKRTQAQGDAPAILVEVTEV
jgi:Holliday junction resolvase RusA-like endonuclease